MIEIHAMSDAFAYKATEELLSHYYPETDGRRKIFFDIETTGLSRTNARICLIGAAIPGVKNQKPCLEISQWLCESPEEESVILESFFDFIEENDFLIHYNGDSFDLPFIRSRSQLYSLQVKTDKVPSVDIMKAVKPLKNFLPFINLKQTSLETFLLLPGRKFPDGKQCIKLYKEGRFDKISGHNTEDLYGLYACCSLLSFRQLREDTWRIISFSGDEKEMCFTLLPSFPFPEPVSLRRKDFYLSVHESCREISLLIPSVNGKYRRYYEDYKNYDYIPTEDTAISRSISTFLDRSLRCPATPETCYTWFSLNEHFKSDSEQQYRYLHSLLTCALRNCSSTT